MTKMINVTVLGEVLMRMDIPNSVNTFNGQEFKVYYGGSEANVASALAEKCINTHLLTKVPNNYIGHAVLKHFKSNDVLFNDKVLVDEGRVGIYYTLPGYGSRFSEVIYDRSDSAFVKNTIKLKDIDFNNMDLFHVSGVTAALSQDMQELILSIVAECQRRNILVSYDSNYRMKLWTQKQAGDFLQKILPYTDILFAGRLDFIHMLGFDEKMDDESMIEQIRQRHNNISVISYTKRTVLSNSTHKIIGYYNTKDTTYKSMEVEFEVLDRIGGGDNFTANVLHGILNKLDPQSTIENSIMSSSIQHTFLGDFTNTNNKVWGTMSKTGVDR